MVPFCILVTRLRSSDDEEIRQRADLGSKQNENLLDDCMISCRVYLSLDDYGVRQCGRRQT